jgi:hypothetical protein
MGVTDLCGGAEAAGCCARVCVRVRQTCALQWWQGGLVGCMQAEHGLCCVGYCAARISSEPGYSRAAWL